jgi:hypothetical protein
MYGATNNTHTLLPRQRIQSCITNSMCKKGNKMKVTFQTHIIKVRCYHLHKLENYFKMNNNVCKCTIKVNELEQKLSSILHCVLKIILHFIVFHVKKIKKQTQNL